MSIYAEELIAQGRQNGHTATLVRLLQRRFGPLPG